MRGLQPAAGSMLQQGGLAEIVCSPAATATAQPAPSPILTQTIGPAPSRESPKTPKPAPKPTPTPAPEPADLDPGKDLLYARINQLAGRTQRSIDDVNRQMEDLGVCDEWYELMDRRNQYNELLDQLDLMKAWVKEADTLDELSKIDASLEVYESMY